MNKALIILNPEARGGRAIDLRSRMEALPGGPEVRLTTLTLDARRLAAVAVQEGFKTIVAGGGDGTVNGVVNGIAGSDVDFGILPVGTMNVFATELGIPSGNLERAWSVVTAGSTLTLDLPLANGRHFIQLAGVGLDAEVVKNTPGHSKRALGPLSYLLTLVQIAAAKPPRVLVETDGEGRREGCFVLIGNGRLYGGPFPLFKRASLSDGLLDVVIFKNQSHWDVVRYFQAIAFGNHPELEDVEYFQSRVVQVSSSSSVPVELDGELAGMLPFRFSIDNLRLRVLAPA